MERETLDDSNMATLLKDVAKEVKKLNPAVQVFINFTASIEPGKKFEDETLNDIKDRYKLHEESLITKNEAGVTYVELAGLPMSIPVLLV